MKHWHIFPHMGDGGIALGAALYTNYLLNGTCNHEFSAISRERATAPSRQSRRSRKTGRLSYQHESMKEQASHASELISSGNYVLWFQGRMEYGPRALGDRSILAPSDSESVKERLNLYVKRREWFQPFAPSMLEEEAERMLEYDGKGHDKFMTMAYSVKELQGQDQVCDARRRICKAAHGRRQRTLPTRSCSGT